MRTFLILLLLPLLSLSVVAQSHDPRVVRFVNTGEMHVALSATDASLYIPDAILADSLSSIVQDGVTIIGGNFYQNAQSKVFALGSDGFTVSSGTIRFVDESIPGQERKIDVWRGNSGNSSAVSARYTVIDPLSSDFYSRVNSYIAFPNIDISTNDTIHVPAIMGIDAINITRNSEKGTLYMESDPIGSNQIFDASLRVTGNSVSAGAVVIEKYVLPFRHSDDGNRYLYPFASPYTNQRAGYFAGNWVRAPRPDSNGHYVYPYANKKSSTADYIDESQYVRYAPDGLTAGSPYLLRLQPDGFAYDLPFIITGGEDHDLDKFVLNGTPYNLSHVEEQKMTGNLYSGTPASAGTKYQWLIGNSYTSAISIDSLKIAIGKSATAFSGNLYVYPHGSTTYQAYNLSTDTDIPDIPAMSVFMLIVSGSNTNTTEPFIITPSMQVHGKSFGNDGSDPLFAPKNTTNELTFRLTPEDNPYIYDQTRIVLESGLFHEPDLSKSLNTSSDYFQLYSGDAETSLAKNVMSDNTTETQLFVTPSKYPLSCRLTVSGLESLTRGTLLLHDSKLDVWTDLFVSEDYIFESEPEDIPSRFTVYFQSPTYIEEVSTTSVYASCQSGYLYLNRLQASDLGSTLQIYNTSGMLVQESSIDYSPQYSVSLPFPDGVYIAKLIGDNNQVFKFLKR